MSDFDVNKTVRELATGKVPEWITDHLRIYRERGGRQGHLFDASFAGGGKAIPTLLLTTIGRRSGSRHTMPLIYGEVDGRYVIIGSKGGAATHAAWYYNLLTHPEVELQVGPEVFAARAHTAQGEERTQLWQHMANLYPPFVEYQSKTKREIPVVVLERN